MRGLLSRPAAPLAVALVLLASCFVLLHVGWYGRGRTTDVPVYKGYADLVRKGAVPYRDFLLEYPPGALPVFVAAAYLPVRYAAAFSAEMFVCGVLALAAGGVILRAADASPRRMLAALGAIALAPLALGSLLDSRFDLWPAALTVAALAALVYSRPKLAGALLALAVSAKLYPLVVVPVGLLYLVRRRGRQDTWRAAASFLLVSAVLFGPFAAVAPGGLYHSLNRQLGRPLQVESLGAATLMAAHHLAGVGLRTVTAVGPPGSQNLSGRLPAAAAAGSTAMQVIALIALWGYLASRATLSDDDLVAGSAAAIALFIAFAKVFSPQFLIWLIPLVPLVKGRRGVSATVLLLAALGLTQSWFPRSYYDLAFGYVAPQSWFLLVRDLVVVALALTLAWGLGTSGAQGSADVCTRS